MTTGHFFTYFAIALSCIIAYGIIELLIIKYNGKLVPAPNIPRAPQTSGQGLKLTYVIMGDSTSIGQGAEYRRSYAVATTSHLANSYRVTLTNTGVSGAKIGDVLDDQLSKVVALKPDVVLLGIGANDTTHFTNLKRIQQSLQEIVDLLKQANPNVRIVTTRSPALDSVSRFPPISKYILRIRTERVNDAFDDIIKKNHLTPALIAEKTRTAFLAYSSLTANDNFHPNARGYALWTPIINEALDQALASTKK
ncbi:MAG: lysophospholipase L1-like esterase [Candidatus Saccharibacteria bacterium]|nr:lysophospholipase L1-like esterase [Candidatus Saccharibacteria bacterium]